MAEESAENLNPLRSKESTTRSPVKFENKTDGVVEIFWLDFAGREISYGKLRAAPSSIAINTFVTHPWIAVDFESKQRLLLNSKDVFNPPVPAPVRVVVGPGREQLRVKRTSILITHPVFNAERLMDLCCHVVSNTIKFEDIGHLPLPHFIINEIKTHYNM